MGTVTWNLELTITNILFQYMVHKHEYGLKDVSWKQNRWGNFSCAKNLELKQIWFETKSIAGLYSTYGMKKW